MYQATNSYTSKNVVSFDSLLAASAPPMLSADWRFFLPDLPTKERALVVAREQDGLAANLSTTFNSVITLDGWSSRSANASQLAPSSSKPSTTLCALLSQAPFPLASFDLVALPYGLTNNISEANHQIQLAGLQTARRLLRPGGALYIGFAGSWSYRRLFAKPALFGARATPGRIFRLLERAGYSSITVYGAIPDHLNPDYLLPLQNESIRFVLAAYFKKKGVSKFLQRRLTSPWAAGWIKWFLPAYGIIAQTASANGP
ncbi:MAG: methyltransferase domain-containing protein [Ardenticatenaceae bacterium]